MRIFKIILIIFIVSVIYFFVFDVSYTCTLFKNKLGCYDGNLEMRLDWLGVDNSRSHLKKLYDDGFLTQGQCHTLGHKIGQNAARSGLGMTEAMEENGSFCGWAFFHGVMEGLFGEDAGHGRISVEEAHKICEEAEYKNDVERFNCFHALGHGFYALDRDLENSLDHCDIASEDYKKGFCYDGVFMAMTFPKEGPRRMELRSDLNNGGQTSICNELAGLRQLYCYWRLVPITVFIEELELPPLEHILGILEKIPDNYKSTFWNGFGRELDSRFASDSRVIENGCQWGFGQNLSCIKGAAMHMIFYDRDNRDRAVELCRDVLRGEDQAQCVDDVKKSYPGI